MASSASHAASTSPPICSPTAPSATPAPSAIPATTNPATRQPAAPTPSAARRKSPSCPPAPNADTQPVPPCPRQSQPHRNQMSPSKRPWPKYLCLYDFERNPAPNRGTPQLEELV